MTTWQFNKNYKDLNQVAAFLPDYLTVYDEIRKTGQYPYNDSFKGRVSGIEGEDEDTAIYLLQKTRHQFELQAKVFELQAKVNEALDTGFQPLDTVDSETKFTSVIHYAFENGETGWQRWNQARVIPHNNNGMAVLPKGKRTHGHILYGKVLVK
jgi:hypothetical protein